MSDSFPLNPGDSAIVAMLSPCVGGLVRTWTDSGPGRLWSVTDADYLRAVQGTGTLARTVREEHRFREVALLSEGTGTLMLQPRYPSAAEDDSLQFEGALIRLEPAGNTSDSVDDDMRSLLAEAINHGLANGEFLAVEKGGWEAPSEPFCLFAVIPNDDGFVSIIEAGPAPSDSEIWGPHIVAGQASTALSAHADRDTIDVAPIIMLEAIASWGLEPWDLALTFGRQGVPSKEPKDGP